MRTNTPAINLQAPANTATGSKKAGRRSKNSRAVLGDGTNTNYSAADVAAMSEKLTKLQASYDLLEKQVAAQPDTTRVDPTIPRPLQGTAGQDYNLQDAMHLDDNDELYQAIRRSVRAIASRAGLDHRVHWKHQPKDKICQIVSIARARQPYLKKFVQAWPVEEFIKSQLKNKRAYMRKNGYDALDMGVDTAGGNADEEAEDGQGDDSGIPHQRSRMSPSNNSM